MLQSCVFRLVRRSKPWPRFIGGVSASRPVPDAAPQSSLLRATSRAAGNSVAPVTLPHSRFFCAGGPADDRGHSSLKPRAAGIAYSLLHLPAGRTDTEHARRSIVFRRRQRERGCSFLPTCRRLARSAVTVSVSSRRARLEPSRASRSGVSSRQLRGKLNEREIGCGCACEVSGSARMQHVRVTAGASARRLEPCKPVLRLPARSGPGGGG